MIFIMKLHLDKEVFIEIIEAASDHMSIPMEFIEKDYYVSLLLWRIADKFPNIIFKGGTSLSKCHKLIKRFSEDIDITVNSSIVNNRVRMNLKDSIVNAINKSELRLINPEDIKSRTNYNEYNISYPTIIGSSGNLRDYLLVETYLSTKSYPTEDKPVSNFISDFLKETGYEELISKYNLQGFKIKVQAVIRTLIDKIFAVCDYFEKDQLKQNSRHLYDIHQIWSNNTFDKTYFKELFEKVAADRSSNLKHNISFEKNYGIAHTMNKIISDKVYEEDYKNITENLLFRNHLCSYDESINSLKELMNKGLIPNKVGQTFSK